MDEQKMTGYASIDKPWLKYYTDEAINAKLPECTVYEYLWENNKEHLDDVAIEYFGRKISYRKLFESIDRTAAAFAALGVRKGDIVSLVMLNSPETICAIYALNKLGAICNIIEPRTNNELIVKRINETRSKAVIVHDFFKSKLKGFDLCVSFVVVVSLKQSMPFLTKLGYEYKIGRKLSDCNLKYREIDWPEFLMHDAKTAVAKYSTDTSAIIIYTGGTTGISKGAMLSNDALNNIVVHQKSSNPCMVRGDTFLDIMPPFIAYGLACGVHIPLCVGMKSILIPNFAPSDFGKLIKKYRPNHVLGVPAFWASLENDSSMHGHDLSYLKSAITGGDRINTETEKAINSFLLEHNSQVMITKGYGMTEACSSVTFTSAPENNKIESVGIPQVHNNFKVVDVDTNKELRYNEVGEICFTGPTMMVGYFNDSEETENIIKTHADGRKWIHSHDIGYIDEDGVVFIIDRMKRMLIRPDGHNVWPSQIESVICSHPAVAQCSVVGQRVDGSKSGVLPAAFVVVNGGYDHERLRQELIKLNFEKLPERDTAQYYYFIDALPLTPVGKVDYRRLEEMANGK